jgi:hypothetical protein
MEVMDFDLDEEEDLSAPSLLPPGIWYLKASTMPYERVEY